MSWSRPDQLTSNELTNIPVVGRWVNWSQWSWSGLGHILEVSGWPRRQWQVSGWLRRQWQPAPWISHHLAGQLELLHMVVTVEGLWAARQDKAQASFRLLLSQCWPTSCWSKPGTRLNLESSGYWKGTCRCGYRAKEAIAILQVSTKLDGPTSMYLFTILIKQINSCNYLNNNYFFSKALLYNLCCFSLDVEYLPEACMLKDLVPSLVQSKWWKL